MHGSSREVIAIPQGKTSKPLPATMPLVAIKQASSCTWLQSPLELPPAPALELMAVGVPVSASSGGAARLETVAGALVGAAFSSLTCLSAHAFSLDVRPLRFCLEPTELTNSQLEHLIFPC